MTGTASHLNLVQEPTKCFECHEIVSRDDAIMRYSQRLGDVYFHTHCWSARELRFAKSKESNDAMLRQRAERENVRRIEDVIKAKPGIARAVPNWGWCRIGTPEFKSRVKSSKLRAFAEHWTSERGSALLLGKSGVGKTAALVALVCRLIDEIDPVSPNASAQEIGVERRWRINGVGPIGDLLWTQATEIANARFRSKLGEEPAIIAKSKSAGMLVIDEMTQAPPEEAFLEVIDHRYQKQASTLVSSGLNNADFESRYGSAIYRRLTDPGLGNLIE